MMRMLYSVAILAGTLALAAPTLAAPAAEPVTSGEFLARCKADPGFCRLRILAEISRLAAGGAACIPGATSRDQVAARVADAIDDVLEESPDDFKDGQYRALVDQIVSFLWPCQPKVS